MNIQLPKIGIASLCVAMLTSWSASAALITFDGTTDAATRATGTYQENDYNLTFVGKDTIFVDSSVASFGGIFGTFVEDALLFQPFGEIRTATTTIAHKDGLAFNLDSFWSGTLRTSPNDQGDLYFRGLKADGSTIDFSLFIANARTFNVLNNLTNLVSLTISRNIDDLDIEQSYLVIDDLTLSLFSPTQISNFNLPPTSNLPVGPTSLLFGAGLVLLASCRRNS